MVRKLLAASFVLGMWGAAAPAQDCGGSYVIQRGDSLSRIAATRYRNAFRWTQIYQANQTIIGPDPDKILVGQRIELPCLSGRPQVSAEASAEESQLEDSAQPEPLEIELAAFVGAPPFSDPSLPGGGMIAEIVEKTAQKAFPTAAQETLSFVPRGVLPQTSSSAVQISFPWVARDCGTSSAGLCRKVILSDPMFEVLVVIFAKADQPISLRDPADIDGKVMCGISDTMVDVLNAGGRDWLKSGLIELRIETSAEQCFQALLAGTADGVVINEFTGRYVAQQMGVEEHVQALTKSPLSISTVHAGLPRSAPKAAETMSSFNAGLRDLRTSGEYQAILNRHLGQMWQGS